MKTTLIAFLFTTLTLITFAGCAAEKSEHPPVKVEGNKFRTINADNNQRTNTQTVVCHNCSAQFKLSNKIHKMSMKGDAVVDCPICHHNYLEKAKK